MRSLEIHDARGPRDRTRGRKWCRSRPPARRVAARPVRRAVPRVAGVRGTRGGRRSGGHGGGRVTRYGPAAPPQPPVITKTTKHMNTLITLNAQFGRRTNTLSRGPGDRAQPTLVTSRRTHCMPPKAESSKAQLPLPAASSCLLLAPSQLLEYSLSLRLP